jgi:predicted HTH transcriptional regulator
MIASAVDFVLSKINLYIGDRSKSIQVDVQYELPVRAVTEAIVNAVAHRDYTSNASVQVMLFPDRLEILNPGKLPMGLTIEELYSAHRSIPANPLIADALYLHGTIEKMGTGTEDILNLCTQMGLKQPKFKQGSGFEAVIYRKTYSDRPADQDSSNKAAIGSDRTAIDSDRPAIFSDDRESAIIDFLTQNEYGKNSDFARLLTLSPQRTREILSSMATRGVIKKHGDKRHTYYTIVNIDDFIQ